MNSILLLYSGADPGFDQGGAPDRDRPKTAILGPQFCSILVLGPHFWWSGGAGTPPGSAPDILFIFALEIQVKSGVTVNFPKLIT